jgi:hypothetical protein
MQRCYRRTTLVDDEQSTVNVSGSAVLLRTAMLTPQYLHTQRVQLQPEYDIASLCMVSFYCFVIKACAKRPGAAASEERRRRERRTLLAGTAGKLAGAIRVQQARPSSACTFSELPTCSVTSRNHRISLQVLLTRIVARTVKSSLRRRLSLFHWRRRAAQQHPQT